MGDDQNAEGKAHEHGYGPNTAEAWWPPVQPSRRWAASVMLFVQGGLGLPVISIGATATTVPWGALGAVALGTAAIAVPLVLGLNLKQGRRNIWISALLFEFGTAGLYIWFIHFMIVAPSGEDMIAFSFMVIGVPLVGLPVAGMMVLLCTAKYYWRPVDGELD